MHIPPNLYTADKRFPIFLTSSGFAELWKWMGKFQSFFFGATWGFGAFRICWDGARTSKRLLPNFEEYHQERMGKCGIGHALFAVKWASKCAYQWVHCCPSPVVPYLGWLKKQAVLSCQGHFQPGAGLCCPYAKRSALCQVPTPPCRTCWPRRRFGPRLGPQPVP